MAWDLVLQGAQQSFCDRSILFHKEPSLGVFPGNFGTEIRSLGNDTTKAGRSLLLLRNVQRLPEEILSWYTGSAIMMRYTTRFYLFPSDCDPASSEDELVAALVAGGPPDGAIRVQCNPRTLESALGTRLPDSFQLHPVNFSHVLDVVEADGKFYYGIRPRAGFFCRPWNTVKPTDVSCSRAKHKLQEVCDSLQLAFPPGSAAIDIGAAPGGWTDLLAGDKQLHVYAVDPAELDPQVAALQGVTHIKKVAEDACEELLRLLIPPGHRVTNANGTGLHGSHDSSNAKSAVKGPPPAGGSEQAGWHYTCAQADVADNYAHCSPADANSCQTPSDSISQSDAAGDGSINKDDVIQPVTGCRVTAESDSQQPLRESGDGRTSATALSDRQTNATTGRHPGAVTRGNAVLLVCDMNCHPGDAVPAINPLLSCIAPGGWLVLTLKFFGLGKDKSKWHSRVVERLGRTCIRHRMLWCYANSDYERTFIAQLR